MSRIPEKSESEKVGGEQALGGDRRKQARARIISAAHRSTLPPPPVLAKPVTAGPTPCGPSFTPAPTPLPFPPPPTPTFPLPPPHPPCLFPTAPPPPYDPEEFPLGQRKKALASLLFGAIENECGSLGLKLILVCSSFTCA